MNARCVYPLVVLLLAVAGLPICVRAATQSDPVVDPSLVGWWTFDDTDSGLIADASGWGRDGIYMGNPKRVGGVSNLAVQFDGVNDYIATDYAENLPEWTVCVWVKSPAAPAEAPASGPVHRQGNYHLNWDHPDSDFRGAAGLRIDDTWYAASFGALSADTWYHLAATFDGAVLRSYVDGVWIAGNETAHGVPFPETSALVFGKHGGKEHFFAGTIDDVRLYRRALTENEISDIVHVDQHLIAWAPRPAYGAAVDIRTPIVLSWSPADETVMYDLYFDTVKEAVEVADIGSPSFVGRQGEMSFPLDGPLEFGAQYFWRVDAVAADGATVRQGPVWTFRVADYLIVDGFEGYTDEEGNRIYERWRDGEINHTGSIVGNPTVSTAEPTFVHEGKRAMSLAYDNLAAPFYSEAQYELPAPEDWTLYGVDTLSLWFRGDPAPFTEMAPGMIAMSAAGNDIWSNVDQCRYVYKQLTGDGAIVARVDGILETNAWAKAGVMIRKSLSPGSIHGFMLLTPDGRRVFQNRLDDGSGFCYSAHSYPGAVTLPHWIKLEREGSLITAYHSVDGVSWVLQPDTENPVSYLSSNPRTIHMWETVHIGLALTSHASGTATSAVFSNIQVTGAVTHEWQSADIGCAHPSNCPERLYVTLENSAGKVFTIGHPDPKAVNTSAWTEWRIPLNDLGRMSVDQISKIYIGLGNRRSPVPNGIGRIYIDDIRLVRSEP